MYIRHSKNNSFLSIFHDIYFLVNAIVCLPHYREIGELDAAMLRKDGLVLGLQDQLAGLLDTEREEAVLCLDKDKQLSLQERALDSLQNMTALQASRGGARDTALRILQYTIFQATYTNMEPPLPL